MDNEKRGEGMSVFRMTGYDRTLLELRLMTAEFGGAVREHLEKALATLKSDIQEDWHMRDEVIDQARDQIVRRCFEIMGLQQLRDQDLRWLLGYQRIAQELERIADYACDVAELSELRADRIWSPEILHMAGHLVSMFDGALAGLREEKALTLDLDDQDNRLDQIYAELQKELIRASRKQKMDQELGFKLLLARTMERMGDHVVNVAGELLFVQTGQRRSFAQSERKGQRHEGVEER